jgi:hypothetical protein
MRASFFASRSLTRAGFVASFILLAACGSDGPTPFALTVIGDDGTVASGAPIVRSAIDRVQVVLAPQAIDGPFAPMPERVFDGGAASTRVSAAGEWVLTLERAWLDDFANAGESLRFDVLLTPEERTDGALMDPTIRVLFYRGTVLVAESAPRFLEWPLVPGGSTSVTVVCRGGATESCAGR